MLGLKLNHVGIRGPRRLRTRKTGEMSNWYFLSDPLTDGKKTVYGFTFGVYLSISSNVTWRRYEVKPLSALLTFVSGIRRSHYSDAIISAMASQITGVSSGCPTVCSGVDQIKHQSSASLASVRGIHRWPVNSPHKGTVTQNVFSIWWRHHCRWNSFVVSLDKLFNKKSS